MEAPVAELLVHVCEDVGEGEECIWVVGQGGGEDSVDDYVEYLLSVEFALWEGEFCIYLGGVGFCL